MYLYVRTVKFHNREETQHHLRVCIAVAKHLVSNHGLCPKREWYIILDREDRIVSIPQFEITKAQALRKEKYRNPDLLWWDNGLWICEIDGYVHHIKSANTEKRDNIYKNNNCKYIVIETFEMGKTRVVNRSIESIINELDYKIMEIKNECK